MLSKKHFIFGTIIGLVLLIAYVFTIPDGKLHIFFCNVGQGDAAYIRTPSNQDMLIDGGPDDKVLTCLGRHMPFYDRTIDVIVLSHPQKDHMQGLISVVKRYNIKYFIIGVEKNETAGYKLLVQELKKKNITYKNLYTGDKFSLGKVEFDVLWPERKWVVEHTDKQTRFVASAGDAKREQIAMKISRGWQADPPAGGEAMTPAMVKESEGAVLGLSTDTELNSFSYFLHMKYGSFDTLFTGDGDSRIQPDIMKAADIIPVDVLKFPHHGSKTAILAEFLDLLKPKLAVISVGKNSYGHPTREALDLLNTRSITTKRTDQNGDVEVVSDGNNWKVN